MSDREEDQPEFFDEDKKKSWPEMVLIAMIVAAVVGTTVPQIFKVADQKVMEHDAKRVAQQSGR